MLPSNFLLAGHPSLRVVLGGSHIEQLFSITGILTTNTR